MPLTPFHFGTGAVLHGVAPRHVSFLSFCAANVLIDIEPLCYMLAHQYPLHRFFHTYIGATLIFALTLVLFVLTRRLAHFALLPSWLQCHELKAVPIAIGAAAGSYSHIVMDSVMHSDITPMAPFSDANILLGAVSLDAMHWLCIAAGPAAVVWLGIRRALGK